MESYGIYFGNRNLFIACNVNFISSINERRRAYMRTVQKILCLAMMSLSCVWADAVVHTMDMQNTCVGSYDTDEALSSETLYNQTNALLKHEVRPWLYQVRNASDWMYEHFEENATLECVVVLYYNDMYMPDILVAFLDTFNLTRTVMTRTKKQVCLDAGRLLVEIENMNVYLLGDIHVRTRIEITAPDTLHTVTQITTDVSAYTSFLSDTILDMIKKTVREKADTVSASLCRIPSPSSSLRRAEDMKEHSVQD